MKTKRIILSLLIIITSATIFFFSSQDGEESTRVSNTVTTKVIDTYTSLKKENISASRKNEMIKNMSFYIRKLAHFVMYFILGLLVYLFVSTYDFKYPFVISLFCVFLFASSDEAHQLCSFGRSAQITDVLLDTLGAFCGMSIINIFKKLGLIHKKNKNTVV